VDEVAEQEFREYVAARQGALYRTALLLTGHREDAEDLVQTALTKLAIRWTRLRGTGSPDAYIRKILYHQHVSRWRTNRNRREYVSAIPPEPDAVGDPTVESALRLSVATALRKLTAKQRAILVMRYFEDRPESEVAEILGCSIGTVRSQTYRTLARLRVLCPELSSILETA
jgi:RNA polymerase sigma-70 factor (sigma-E family)